MVNFIKIGNFEGEIVTKIGICAKKCNTWMLIWVQTTIKTSGQLSNPVVLRGLLNDVEESKFTL